MTGEIVHVEFPAADPARAQGFWEGLFGWKFGDSGMPGMDYRIARTGEASGAAVYESDEHSGHPHCYFDTADIEDAIAKVRSLGGSADDKGPVPGMGWFARCRDTEGNEFHLWQADAATAPAS